MRKLSRNEYLAACVVAGTLGLTLTACSGSKSAPAPAPRAAVTHTTPAAAPAADTTTTGCSQINSTLDSVFNGSYASLPPAVTTSDLMNDFLGTDSNATSAMATIMTEQGTSPALRAAEAQLNTDVNTAVNTSYATSAQNSAALSPLKTIKHICGTSAAWTQVALAPAGLVTPTAAAPTSAAPSTPSMSAAQQQAVDSAQSYLNLGSGFSYAGLLKQLTSNYGSGFTTSSAQFAINYLNPDWNAQAVLSAKSYLALGTGFSRVSLIQQLTSSYGAGFTEAQAEYAVSKVGL